MKAGIELRSVAVEVDALSLGQRGGVATGVSMLSQSRGSVE